jgi:hypothetical protein
VNLQDEIDSAPVVHTQLNSGFQTGFESGRLRGYVVVSYGKKWNHILAAEGSGQATKDYGLIRINHDDCGTGDGRATWVRDSA